MSAPAIRVRHLSHRFGSYDVLRDVSFEVAHGEIFGFIGPNGAGKTTTIRAMATLLEPMGGRIEIDGVDVALDAAEVRRRIGYMPDHAGVYDRLTVREYLEFFAEAHAVPSMRIVDSVIELTDMGSLEQRLVATMSKGMKQRLQLARVLLHDPKVLILDEPASDLDPRARIEIRDLLVELQRLGKTIFLSSHILTELSDVCTSVGILERGQLVVAGPIHSIGERLDAIRRGANMGPATSNAAHLVAPPPLERKRTLKIRALGDPAEVARVAREVPGVEHVDTEKGTTLVRFVGADDVVAAIVKHLVLANVPIIGVEPERNELERLFLEATRGDVQ